MSDGLKQRITDDMKSAMRSAEKQKLSTIRLILAAIKQVEVDTRKELSDPDVLAILDKMAKQRRESIAQFEQASRDDLVAQEVSELAIITDYLPAALSDEEINDAISKAIADSGASSIKDMGKVMAQLKPALQGRADMGKVSQLVKAKLSA